MALIVFFVCIHSHLTGKHRCMILRSVADRKYVSLIPARLLTVSGSRLLCRHIISV